LWAIVTAHPSKPWVRSRNLLVIGRRWSILCYALGHQLPLRDGLVIGHQRHASLCPFSPLLLQLLRARAIAHNCPFLGFHLPLFSASCRSSSAMTYWSYCIR
jgi:hypothetical protein